MGAFYNPKRGADWNYGGKKWRLSRSKIDLFVECPKCFYIDNKLGTKRPPGYPLNLNIAVDTLLKKEFDIHRVDKTAHPLMEQYKIDAIPFEHADMDKWRNNFKGIDYLHESTGMVISGAIDDVWQGKNGDLIIVDYKATSKDGEVNLDAEWQNSYKRQMEVYQWLFRQNGFNVSDTGYFVYANGSTDKEAFDSKLEFDVKIIPYTGSDAWVEKTIQNIHKCLNDERVPAKGTDCDYCPYREVVGQILLERQKNKKNTSTVTSKDIDIKEEGAKSPEAGTLF